MTGASHTLQQQAAVAQNLANTNTPGFRAAINTFRAVPLVGEGLATRSFVVDATAGADFTEMAKKVSEDVMWAENTKIQNLLFSNKWVKNFLVRGKMTRRLFLPTKKS